jgi:hypothetical protein
MNEDLLHSDAVLEWQAENPRLWWAFEQLDPHDDFRARVLAGIVSNNILPAVIDGLVRLADALENNQRGKEAGTSVLPPEVGLRRSINLVVTRLTKINWNMTKTFRVDFVTPQGWSGYFDTQNPRIVEITTKFKAQPITVVGEIERHIYDFLVVVKDVRIMGGLHG